MAVQSAKGLRDTNHTDVDPKKSTHMQLICGIALLIYLAIGTSMYSVLVGMTFIDALYLSMVILTTVGYGDQGCNVHNLRMYSFSSRYIQYNLRTPIILS